MPVWFLDLDGTLYADATGLWAVISHRINLYLQQRLGLSPTAAQQTRQRWMSTYGTTLRGLMAEHPHLADPAAYFAFAHDVPLGKYLQPDPRLRATLLQLPGTRWLFTNADAPYARRVLRVLGVEDVFAGVVDIFATGLCPKPKPRAYHQALALSDARASEAVLVDDRWENAAAAHQEGWYAVWVHPHDAAVARRAAVDAVIPTIYALPQQVVRQAQGEG